MPQASKPIVRFAPSPTGLIHLGNARTALLNWLFAKKKGGQFILRFDDTDQQRSRPEYAEGIAHDLTWLGVQPDITVKQSDRFPLYAAAAEKLKTMGLLYPCYESADELDRRRKRQMARGLPPVYDRASLALTDAEKQVLELEGKKPHWRFKLDAKVVRWDDLVRGACEADCGSLSDPVLVREDGTYLYTLPSVVDDIEMRISHVIRGEDHVTNTAVQIQIFEVLTRDTTPHIPQFGHHNLLTTMSGEGLSKRMGHLSLTRLRENGFEPMAINSLAVLVGTSESIRAIETLPELGDLVDLSHISRAPAKFDEAELSTLNTKIIHAMPYVAAQPRLKVVSADGGEAFWLAVRGNLSRVEDAAPWYPVVFGDITPQHVNAEVLAAAKAHLPQEPWDHTTWSTWITGIKTATSAKGKALFEPLRLALTGKEHGPELAPLLPLIGRARVLERL
jgi:glutamyl-tRNA synthetase